jgi:hypothetical protein
MTKEKLSFVGFAKDKIEKNKQSLVTSFAKQKGNIWRQVYIQKWMRVHNSKEVVRSQIDNTTMTRITTRDTQRRLKEHRQLRAYLVARQTLSLPYSARNVLLFGSQARSSRYLHFTGFSRPSEPANLAHLH